MATHFAHLALAAGDVRQATSSRQPHQWLLLLLRGLLQCWRRLLLPPCSALPSWLSPLWLLLLWLIVADVIA